MSILHGIAKCSFAFKSSFILKARQISRDKIWQRPCHQCSCWASVPPAKDHGSNLSLSAWETRRKHCIYLHLPSGYSQPNIICLLCAHQWLRNSLDMEIKETVNPKCFSVTFTNLLGLLLTNYQYSRNFFKLKSYWNMEENYRKPKKWLMLFECQRRY